MKQSRSYTVNLMGKWKQSRLCNGHSPVVLMLAALAGCSYYSQADGARLRDEVYGLQTEVDALQKRLRTIKNSQEQSGERIARMSSDVADLNTSARRNDADLGVVMEVVRQDVARMKGQVDTLVDRVSSLESETAQSREETELRFQALADETKLRAQANEREREQAADKAQAKDKLLRTPRKAIESARRLVKDSPQEARQLLRALELKRGKRRGWATYAPEVTYLIGETYFAENDFQQAAASFNVIRKKYPQSLKWVPNSILKLGMCLERLDLADDAKLFYQRVEKKYPNHPAAKQARRLLRKMRG